MKSSIFMGIFIITIYGIILGYCDKISFNMQAINMHNALRKLHGVQPLKYNSKLADLAQQWANKLAKNNSLGHRPGNKYGESIFWTTGREPLPSAPVRTWYNEIKFFRFGKEPAPSVLGKIGHFTQLIWKGSKEIGLGTAKTRNGWFVVANYNPPGNVKGQFAKNVPRPNNRG